MRGDDHLVEFIRHTLGCGCPNDVFEKIKISCLADDLSAGPPVQRINVGDRLLIYLAADSDEATVTNLLRAGVVDRDAGGFNRFRLVVSRNDTLPDLTCEQSMTTALFPGDEKVHLHRIPLSEIPQIRQRHVKQA